MDGTAARMHATWVSACRPHPITPSDPVYPFFGRGLERHVRFVYEQDRDAPKGVNWVFVRPDQPSSLCAEAWSVALRTKDGWRIMHRKGARACPA